jgi:glycosyltransferase involved in cell wall biosynthesis
LPSSAAGQDETGAGAHLAGSSAVTPYAGSGFEGMSADSELIVPPVPDEPALSVVIPCLNESENIVRCVQSAISVLKEHGISGEVIVVDNGSVDHSGELARSAGATVIHESRRGYGHAYLAGFAASRGKYIVMADADLTYDFGEVPRFLTELQSGAQLVMGHRQLINPGAMPWMNRYVGNPIMTRLVNGVFRTSVSDAWCGMRALRRDVLPALELRAPGMEFALEMVIRASEERLDVRQIPIELHPRGGTSKLAPFRDGWRAVRLILTYSPNHLFMLPGLLMALLGGFIVSAVLAGVSIFGRHWYVHALVGGSLLVIIGTQVISLGVCGQAYARFFLNRRGTLFARAEARGFRLKHGLAIGGTFLLVGLSLGLYLFIAWANESFGPLFHERLAVIASMFIIIGTQIVFTSLLISMLGLRRPA